MEARIELNICMHKELEVFIQDNINQRVTDYKVVTCANAIRVEVYDHEMTPLPFTDYTIATINWDFTDRKWVMDKSWEDILAENKEIGDELHELEHEHFDQMIEEEETMGQQELEEERLARQHEELWP